MKVDVCAICGTESTVADPESEPPYAHLSCVAGASAKQRIEEIHAIDFHRPGSLFPIHRSEHSLRMSKRGDKIRRDSMANPYEMAERGRNSPRTRLHPAVFETYYRPITLAQEPPLRSQSTTAPAPPAPHEVT